MINVAQIGVGYWGPNLLRNLIENPRCKIKTVVELSQDRRSYVKNLYPKVNVSDNLNDVLLDSSIKAVVISTPVHTHFDLSMKCLSAGKNILVEKPMATSSQEVEAIKLLANKTNLIAMVGHTFLFNSSVRYIKKIIDNGEIGDLRYIYSQRLNLGRIREDVDAMWNLAPHDISVIQYWMNDIKPENIIKIGMDYVQEKVDDVVFLNIRYPNKVIANIHVSWLDPNKVRKIVIVGSKKMIVYDDISDDKVTIFDKGIDPVADLKKNMDYDIQNFTLTHNHRSGEIKIPVIDSSEPLKNEINHFFDCIIGSASCITGPEHAKSVVEILELAK